MVLSATNTHAYIYALKFLKRGGGEIFCRNISKEANIKISKKITYVAENLQEVVGCVIQTIGLKITEYKGR